MEIVPLVVPGAWYLATIGERSHDIYLQLTDLQESKLLAVQQPRDSETSMVGQ